jgi:hypothetical protein
MTVVFRDKFLLSTEMEQAQARLSDLLAMGLAGPFGPKTQGLKTPRNIQSDSYFLFLVLNNQLSGRFLRQGFGTFSKCSSRSFPFNAWSSNSGIPTP